MIEQTNQSETEMAGYTELVDVVVIEQAARLIAHSTEPDYAIQSILRLLSQLLGLNRGRVLVPDEQNGVLHIRYAYGLTADEKERGVYSLGEGVSGRVMKTGQTALIQNIDDEPYYLGRAVARPTLPNETVSYIAVSYTHLTLPTNREV